LFNIFYDNKNSRALYLEQEFSNARMEQFPNASTYCQHLKALSDQLSNVGAPVSNERLVLQLISGLTDAYATVGSQIRHGDSLPHFYKARSMIILEETTKAKKAATTVDNSVFLTSHDDYASASTGNNRNNNNNNSHGSNPRGGRNNGRGGRGRGRSNGRGRSQPQQPAWFPSPYQQHPWAYPWEPWATPPCPYPTAGAPPKQSGILGPRPHQANLVTAPSVSTGQQTPQYYAPTNIQAAMHTFSISLSNDQWYMDSGSTSHMTGNGGNLTSYFNMSNNIPVGNGHHIPVVGSGHASLPNSLTLNNVLHAPKLIKNLVSVRKFTIDNDISIEFDLFGFSVKDLQTGTLLMRCNSSGDLYPIPTSQHTAAAPPPPSTFAASSTKLWHCRLGHPGAPILNSLHRNKFLLCNKCCDDFFFQSCPLGKQIKLPFSNSL